MINISFVSDDSLLIERIKIFAGSSGKIFTFFYSRRPVFDPEFDIIVAPAHYLSLLTELCEQRKYSIPFIIYGSSDKLAVSFQSGAVDYLKDPWNMAELGQRILNYFGHVKRTWLKQEISVSQAMLKIGSRTCPLTYREYLLLRVLLQNYGNLVYSETIRLAVWGNTETSTKALDMLIMRLRKKIRNILPAGNEKKFICSVKSKGYLITSDNEDDYSSSTVTAVP